MKIKACRPDKALPGGLVRIELQDVKNPAELEVRLGEELADILGSSQSFLTVRIPEGGSGQLSVFDKDREYSAPLTLGTVLVDDLHPVANPVVDALGNIYITFSGARGETVPFGVFVIHPDGSKHPFLGDIVNPTGLVIGPDDCLYISSRHTGTVYRSTFDKQVEKFAEGLGVASGMAFDSRGNLFVGDRSGTIHKVRPDRNISAFCELEPSVSAYHLVIDSKDVMYVTGPTLATQDSIYQVTPEGEVSVFFKGFGRPQGLAFDPRGKLQVTGSFRGRKGLYTFANGSPERTVASSMLVGLAHDPLGAYLYLVDNQRLYRIKG
jgi:sugar lactone lactonase YvrE